MIIKSAGSKLFRHNVSHIFRRHATVFAREYPIHHTEETTGKDTLHGLLDSFDAPINYAFGYGSGVFSQGIGQRNSNTQVDLIIGVENPVEWHEVNINQNPHHYSSLRHLGASAISWVQENLGAGVYFNPFVTINDVKVKYGVVSIETLRRDLVEWQTLYLAGRLHKPVRILKNDAIIDQAQQQNLYSALGVAMLLLPEHFSERDLYMKLAGVSYMGDVRMALAENPNKVRNIVNNQFQLFRKLYKPIAIERGLPILTTDHVGPDAQGLAFEQSLQRNDRLKLLDSLPDKFRAKLPDSILDDHKARSMVAAAVRSTVKRPSFTQTAKGLLTAGIGRSATYSLEKLRKRWT